MGGKSYFEVTVREVREGTFLVEAPKGHKAVDVECDLDDADLALGDSTLECVNGVLAEGHFEPETEIKVVKLRRKPRGKKRSFRMAPVDPFDEESVLEPWR